MIAKMQLGPYRVSGIFFVPFELNSNHFRSANLCLFPKLGCFFMKLESQIKHHLSTCELIVILIWSQIVKHLRQYLNRKRNGTRKYATWNGGSMAAYVLLA